MITTTKSPNTPNLSPSRTADCSGIFYLHRHSTTIPPPEFCVAFVMNSFIEIAGAVTESRGVFTLFVTAEDIAEDRKMWMG